MMTCVVVVVDDDVGYDNDVDDDDVMQYDSFQHSQPMTL